MSSITKKEHKNENVVTKNKKDRNFSFLSLMQNIGKSLVFPIATLPAAALLLRIGAFVGTFGNDGGFWYWLGFILQTPGSAVFDNMPIIFGIGVAFGFAKENRGEVALVGAIAYFALIGLAQNEGSLSSLVYGNVNLGKGVSEGGKYYSDLLYLNIDVDGTLTATGAWLMNFGVFGGILTGLTTAVIYNKFSGIRLHPALGFFSGRRFVPIITLFIMIIVAFAMAIIWPWVNVVLIYFSIGIASVPWLGAGLYAFANRMLIPFGLHQVLNTYFWFQSPVIVNYLGESSQLMIATLDASGKVVMNDGVAQMSPVLGDINAFADITNGSIWIINGDYFQLTFDALGTNPLFTPGTVDASGAFISNGESDALSVLRSSNIGMYEVGFYPTMMFGLPAVAIAMAMRAEDEYKKQVWAFMIAGSVVAFLTGITEPLEFAFMFISPVIYVVYSALSGVYAMFIVLLGASNGFGFSAGLIDWVISFLGGGIGVLSAHGNWANLEIIAIGVMAAVINFLVTYFLIDMLNIATPGRNGNVSGLSQNEESESTRKGDDKKPKNDKFTNMAKKTIDFIGEENIENIDNCITRVRLTVKDNSIYDDDEVKKIGYSGVVKVGKKAYQMIIGPESEIIANEMRRLLEEKHEDEKN